MAAVTKLGFSLLLSFAALALLALSAELLYVLCFRRRRAASSGDTEGAFGSSAAPSSKKLLLFLVFWKKKNSSRVEPAAAAAGESPPFAAEAAKPAPAAEEGDGDDFARWRNACFGPSLVLFTIREEEEGVDSDVAVAEEAVEEEEEMLFSTPCSSPSFLTPTASAPLPAPESPA